LAEDDTEENDEEAWGEGEEGEEEEPKEQDETVEVEAPPQEAQAAPAPAPAAAAPAAGEQQLVAAEKVNSVTHPNQWREMQRAVKAGKMPTDLTTNYQTSKADLFKTYVECDGNWDSVKATIQRQSEASTTGKEKLKAMKPRDIRLLYPQDSAKGEQVIGRRVKAVLYYPDEDFPNDPEECPTTKNNTHHLQRPDSLQTSTPLALSATSRHHTPPRYWVYMPEGKSLTKSCSTKEIITGEVKVHDHDVLGSLFGDGGALEHGAMPTMATATGAGQLALMNQLHNVPVKPLKGVKNPPPEKPPKPLPLQDAPPSAECEAFMKEVFAEHQESGKYAVLLEAHELSADVVAQCKEHSEFMLKGYKLLQQLVIRKVTKKDTFDAAMKPIKDKTLWFEASRAVAKQMQSAISRPAKAKGKAKAKSKA